MMPCGYNFCQACFKRLGRNSHCPIYHAMRICQAVENQQFDNVILDVVQDSSLEDVRSLLGLVLSDRLANALENMILIRTLFNQILS
jgi:hypothetical protein